MTKEDEPDYPTDYSNGKPIEDDVEEWLENRSVEEVEEEMEDLHVYQLEWIGYKAEGEKQKAIREEIQRRDNADLDHVYGTYGTDNSSTTTDGTRAGVWDSGLEIIDNFGDLAEREMGARSLEQYAKKELGIEKNKVILSEEVRKICVAIQEQVNEEYGGNCEFGVLFKGEWTDEGFVVKPDYVIPEQTASRAHIDYDEDLKKYRDEGYIVNIHSHPWAGESSGFSGTDDSHINSHFDMAVLYAGGAETFADAVANVELDDGATVRISPEVMVEQPDRNLPNVNGVENVETKKRKSTTSSSGKSRRHGHAPKGSYKRYKRNYGRIEEEKSLPDSPDDTDPEQQVFAEIYNY